MEEAEGKSEFRVEKRDIPLLAEALGLPPEISGRWYQGFMYGSKENKFPLPLQ